MTLHFCQEGRKQMPTDLKEKKTYSIMSSLTIYSPLKISHNLDPQTSEVSDWRLKKNECNTDSRKVQ